MDQSISPINRDTGEGYEAGHLPDIMMLKRNVILSVAKNLLLPHRILRYAQNDTSSWEFMAQRTTLTTAEIAFVQKMRAARLATADEHGSPHLVPVCYACDGTRFYTPLDEKPKRVAGTRLRRVRNIQARHEASLLIDQYDDDWSQLGYVLVHGRADVIEPGHPLHTQALKLLRERYIQYRAMNLEAHPVIVITPDRVTSWGPAIL